MSFNTIDEQKIYVKSAYELSPSSKKKIMSYLDVAEDGIVFQLDDSLLAGVQIQGSNIFYDNSIKRQLSLIQSYLSQEGGMADGQSDF